MPRVSVSVRSWGICGSCCSTGTEEEEASAWRGGRPGTLACPFVSAVRPCRAVLVHPRYAGTATAPSSVHRPITQPRYPTEPCRPTRPQPHAPLDPSALYLLRCGTAGGAFARPPQFGWPVIFRLIPFGQTRIGCSTSCYTCYVKLVSFMAVVSQ